MSEQNNPISCPLCSSVSLRSRRKYRDYNFLSCKKCYLEFVYPYMANMETYQNYFWTAPFTMQFDDYSEMALKSIRSKVDVAQKITGQKINSFLDVGCGNGMYVEAAQKLGLKAYGNDIDKQNVDYALKRGLNVYSKPLEEINFEMNFDLIHLKLTLHLVQYPSELFGRLKEMLSPKGVIFIDLPNQRSTYSFFRKTVRRHEFGQLQPPVRNRAYCSRTVKFLVEKHGLKIFKKVSFTTGDPVYYPCLDNDLNSRILMLLSKLGFDSLMGFYIGKTSV